MSRFFAVAILCALASASTTKAGEAADSTLLSEGIAIKGPGLALRFYGEVKATAAYNWGHTLSDPDNFIPNDIPVKGSADCGPSFQTSAAQSTLGLWGAALPGKSDQITARLSLFFIGGKPGSYTPKLRYGYLHWRGLTTGYDYTLFADTKATPPSVDYEGPVGAATLPKAVFDYRVAIPHTKLSVGIGLEQTKMTGTYTFLTREATQRYPDIPAEVRYSNDIVSLRGAAILRMLSYSDVANHVSTTAGWGVQASGIISPLPFLNLNFSATYGRGISSYLQDFCGAGLDLLPKNPNALLAPKGWGGFASLVLRPAKKWEASLTYSVAQVSPPYYLLSLTETAAEISRRTDYICANAFFSPNRYLIFALEYQWGKRKTCSGTRADTSRLQAMIAFGF